MLSQANDALRAHIAAQISPAAFRELTPGYLEEPRGRYAGKEGLLVAPASVEEVSAVVKACKEFRVPLIPYGGGTGLVGGQVAQGDIVPVILSLERMNRIREVRPTENVLIAEAGATLQEVQDVADEAGRLFPLSLASQGSARIGGNLATNAGGVNVLRYGNARDLCLGLEAVMPDGEIWNGLSRLRKDNTGYDLRHLLIGSEGTLGVITAASLRLFPRPSELGAAIFVVPDPQAALELLALSGDVIGGQVSAFELISGQGLRFLNEVGPEVRAPFKDIPTWMVLIDVGTAPGADPQAMLTRLFEAAVERDLASDGVIASSAAQRDQFWSIRESIPEANRRIGSVSSHDISVPLDAIPGFIGRATQNLAKLGDFRINCFGHVGDGNLHYNVFPHSGKSRADHEADRSEVKRIVHDLADEMGGSVSAEHGIGRLKVDDLKRYGDPTKLAVMRSIKAALDPLGIMNPGAVVPDP